MFANTGCVNMFIKKYLEGNQPDLHHYNTKNKKHNISTIIIWEDKNDFIFLAI